MRKKDLMISVFYSIICGDSGRGVDFSRFLCQMTAMAKKECYEKVF